MSCIFKLGLRGEDYQPRESVGNCFLLSHYLFLLSLMFALVMNFVEFPLSK